MSKQQVVVHPHPQACNLGPFPLSLSNDPILYTDGAFDISIPHVSGGAFRDALALQETGLCRAIFAWPDSVGDDGGEKRK